jgi:dolichyl-diphosphooligosaccharide--protein glycosyltransferase
MNEGHDGRRAVTAVRAVATVCVVGCLLLVAVGVAAPQESGNAGNDTPERIPSLYGWDDSLGWLSEDTPDPGQYGDSGEPYSVLSWWDYGDAIVDQGERPAVANVSRKNTQSVARFLLAQNETEALEMLSGEFEEYDEPRYVMIDALMAETDVDVTGKFFALPDSHPDYNRSDFYRRIASEESIFGNVHTQAYYQSMLFRLYHYHGSSKQPVPLVVNWRGRVQETEEGAGIVFALQNGDNLVRFEENLSAARRATAGDPSSQVGGIGPHPEKRVPALEHVRLVHLDEVSVLRGGLGGNETATEAAIDSGLNIGPLTSTLQRTVPLLPESDQPNTPYQNQNERLAFLYETTPSYTKTFERVPGATIEGTVDQNASLDEVTVAVRLNPANGQNFTYSQRVPVEDNEFTATVPYATTGYETWGVAEGYTNTSVRATGPYRIQALGGIEQVNGTQVLVRYRGTVNVTEGQVLGENETSSTVSVEESRQELDFGGGNDGASDDRSGEGNGDGSGNGSESGDGSAENTSTGSLEPNDERSDTSPENGSRTNDSGNDTNASSDGSGPGFGVGGALAGLGGAGYLLRRLSTGA